MIVYSNSVKKFCDDIDNISLILNKKLKEKMHKYSADSERESWDNSLKFFSNILLDTNIATNCTVTLEYNLPLTSNRIDLILSGYNSFHQQVLLVFEFKQWNNVEDVEDSDYIVKTFLNGGMQNVVHPGYQVWSYTQILKDYNLYIQSFGVVVKSCLLIHNYHFQDDDVLLQEKFKPFMKDVTFFGSDDNHKLIKFIESNLSDGDNGQIMINVDSSKIKPSLKLQDSINGLINKNDFFNLIDQQVLVYDKIFSIIKNDNNNVIIVKGGPGTGKSIIAINLLNKLINCGKTCQYVTRNTAPRVIYSYKLKGELKKTNIDFLFKSSGSYTDVKENNIDVLIVDEAHCLTEKSGLFNNYGVNQIEEIIKASNNSIFFVDELQKVHLNDIGSIENISNIAKNLNCKITEMSLDYQFRCNGSNDYLNFVDYILGINNFFDKTEINYDFRVIDTPKELFELVKNKNTDGMARLVAGYCWNWNKKELNNTNYHDIKIDDFEISWNLGQGQTFVIDDSINEAGCIHSVQGLEFDYVGVLIGKDLRFDNKVIADYNFHGTADPSFKGIKKMFKENNVEAQKQVDTLIKNAYRVLLTRGSKGCFVFCEDKSYQEYLKKVVKNIKFNR